MAKRRRQAANYINSCESQIGADGGDKDSGVLCFVNHGCRLSLTKAKSLNFTKRIRYSTTHEMKPLSASHSA